MERRTEHARDRPHGRPRFHTPGLRSAFRAEVKRSTQATAAAAGLVVIIRLPAWAGFDHLVDPAHASTFTMIRFSLEIPLIASGWRSSRASAGASPS